jgi:putative transposase
MRTGEVMNFSSTTGAIFPLEMGHAFHDASFIERGNPQSAKLVHKTARGGIPCDEFEVHVTFEWLTQKRETNLWLGVDRGIYNLAAYCVTDDDGNAIDSGRISGRELRHVQRQEERRTAEAQRHGGIKRGTIRRRAWADEAVHVAANRIVELAVKHGAHVVLEDLKNLSAIRRRVRTPGTRRGGFNRLLNRVQYEKLKTVLAYKLGEYGLPLPIHVSAALTSQTCPTCAHVARENRVKMAADDGFETEAFKCVVCGHEANADENAAHVIAMKGRWITLLPKKSQRTWTTLPDELKFEAHVKGCAERRKGV